jgi:hypothetical protein
MAADNTQQYKVVEVEKGFEIRYYPPSTMASVITPASSYKELGNTGLKKLHAYLLGGNEAKEKIQMIAPVHMLVDGNVSSLSVVMPPQYSKDNLPKPVDSNIMIKMASNEYAAAIKFGGFTSDKDIKQYAEKLEYSLKARSIIIKGNFRFLRYNPQYYLFGRKNEIIVKVI